jgi:hypothetical protein
MGFTSEGEPVVAASELRAWLRRPDPLRRRDVEPTTVLFRVSDVTASPTLRFLLLTVVASVAASRSPRRPPPSSDRRRSRRPGRSPPLAGRPGPGLCRGRRLRRLGSHRAARRRPRQLSAPAAARLRLRVRRPLVGRRARRAAHGRGPAADLRRLPRDRRLRPRAASPSTCRLGRRALVGADAALAVPGRRALRRAADSDLGEAVPRPGGFEPAARRRDVDRT